MQTFHDIQARKVNPYLLVWTAITMMMIGLVLGAAVAGAITGVHLLEQEYTIYKLQQIAIEQNTDYLKI